MTAKKYLPFLLLISFQILSTNTFADDNIKWSELRLFASNNKFSTEPTSLNNLTAADNVQKLNELTGFGLEADALVKSWFKLGTRFKVIANSVYPANSALSSNAYLSVQQYSGGALARIPLIDKEWCVLDVVAELGAANTKIDVQTMSAGKGTFSKNAGLYERAGASIGFGWSSIKFYIEAGQEWNNLSGMTFEGNLNNNISSVDFSGPYYAFGLIISGIPSWIKPGGITVSK